MSKYECVEAHNGRFGELKPGQIIDAADPKLPPCYQRALDERPQMFKKVRSEKAFRQPKNEVETR